MSKRAPVKNGLPTFASERAEREYWETHDTSEFVDWSQARQVVFPNLRASTDGAERARKAARAERPSRRKTMRG